MLNIPNQTYSKWNVLNDIYSSGYDADEISQKRLDQERRLRHGTAYRGRRQGQSRDRHDHGRQAPHQVH